MKNWVQNIISNIISTAFPSCFVSSGTVSRLCLLCLLLLIKPVTIYFSFPLCAQNPAQAAEKSLQDTEKLSNKRNKRESQNNSADAAEAVPPLLPFSSRKNSGSGLDSDFGPGLGIADFSPGDIQQRLDSVRKDSASPLQPEFYPQRREPREADANNAAPSADTTEPPTSSALASQTAPATQSAAPNTMDQQKVQSPLPMKQTRQMKKTSSMPRTNSMTNPILDKRPQVERETKRQAQTGARPTLRAADLNDVVIPQRSSPSEQINVSKTISLDTPLQLSLHGLIWTYIPSLSQYPNQPDFERELGNLETSFRFEFPSAGRYLLAFSRQFPSTGELEYYNAEIIVEGEPGEPREEPTGNTPVETSQAQAFMAEPIETNNVAQKQGLNLKSNANTQNIVENNLNYRITSQVVSGVQRMLDDGELESAYQTLNNWPASERGDIYDTAAQKFLDAGMYSQAVDMWKHNTSLDGELQNRAVVGIVHALTQSADSESLLQWLPEFVEQAKRQQEEDSLLQESLIDSNDFADIYRTLFKLGDTSANDSTNHTVAMADNEKANDILEFYQTYVNHFADSNSPEILYNMGLLFEQPGRHQDIRRAGRLYKNIQVNYPVDEYSQKATERLDYLNRQFFHVR